MQNIKRVTVSNMTSSSGREVPNQFTISTNDGVYFQSYRSVIAFIPSYKPYDDTCEPKHIYLDASKWDYSTTTGKYRNMFLNETKKETEAKIRSGEYILMDLN